MLDRQRLARNGPALGLLLGWRVPRPEPGRLRPGRSRRGWPPSRPTRRRPTRAARSGATLAFVLFQALGWSSYLLLAGLAVVDLLLFRRRTVPEIGAPGCSASRWSLAVAAALVQRFGPGLEPSPPVGSGGYLGALVGDVPRRSVRPGGDAPDPRGGRAVGPGALLRRADRLAAPRARRWSLRPAGSAAPAADRRRADAGRPVADARRAEPSSSRRARWPWPSPIATARPRRRTAASTSRPSARIDRDRSRDRPSAARGSDGPRPAVRRRRTAGSSSRRWSCSNRAPASRSRSTRPRSTPGRCCWSGRCSISATRSASSRSTPGR